MSLPPIIDGSAKLVSGTGGSGNGTRHHEVHSDDIFRPKELLPRCELIYLSLEPACPVESTHLVSSAAGSRRSVASDQASSAQNCVLEARVDKSDSSISSPLSAVDEATNEADVASDSATSDDEAFGDVPQGDELSDQHFGIAVRDRTAQNRPKITYRDFTSPARRPQSINTTGRTNLSSSVMTPLSAMSPGGASVRSTAWSAVLSVFGSPSMAPSTPVTIAHQQREHSAQSAQSARVAVTPDKSGAITSNGQSNDLDQNEITGNFLFGSRQRLND